MTGCIFSNIREYAIRNDTGNVCKVGSLELLENIPGILIEKCDFNNIHKGIVFVRMVCEAMALSLDEDMN